MKKRKIIVYLIFLLTIILISIFLINKQNILKNIFYKLDSNYQTVISSILNNKKTTLKIENDLKTKFLPETQQQDINFKIIKIKELKESSVGYGQKGKC